MNASKIIPITYKSEQKLTPGQINLLCKKYGYDPLVIRSFMAVETGGIGFSGTTGKIIIQFEPAWFKKQYSDWKKDTEGAVWINNGIGNQVQEWVAFNNAYYINANAAMLSTSIGIGQVMGFHFRLLGFKTVGEMWEFAKQSEANQLELILRFIKAKPELHRAVLAKNWHLIAYYYNGAKYKEQAIKYRYTPYNEQMETYYLKLAA